MAAKDLVFVHGWSVHHTDTYGRLPERLVSVGAEHGLNFNVRNIVLGRYISFNDEVRVSDLVAAMEAAVQDLGLTDFYCVTHSTGGPVVREWARLFYGERACPLSHLVMLAPANFGSALAQLGKSRVSRIKSWFSGVEPGQSVLNWLELGSDEALETNLAWIKEGALRRHRRGYFPFVVTGQTIDRKLYDNLNTYTGESGSDGVVRVAAANLNSTYVRLTDTNSAEPDADGFVELDVDAAVDAPRTALLVAAGRAHSGKDIGIMRSVKSTDRDRANQPTVDAIIECFKVTKPAEYGALTTRFVKRTETTQEAERVEVEDGIFRDRVFFNDPHCQVIFRILDSDGHPVDDYDIVLTSGELGPNGLPEGFFKDRQRNSRNPGVVTYYFNYAAMIGCAAIPDRRAALPGCSDLGIELHARPTDGFVRFRPARIRASAEVLSSVIKANQTAIVDIVLTRAIDTETFRLERTTDRASFKRVRPSGRIIP